MKLDGDFFPRLPIETILEWTSPREDLLSIFIGRKMPLNPSPPAVSVEKRSSPDRSNERLVSISSLATEVTDSNFVDRPHPHVGTA